MIVPPYEPLKFPLSTEEFEAILTAPPPPMPDMFFTGKNAYNSTSFHMDYRSSSGSHSYRTKHHHQPTRNQHLNVTNDNFVGTGKSQQKRLNSRKREQQESLELENMRPYFNQRVAGNFNSRYRNSKVFYKRRLKETSSNNRIVDHNEKCDFIDGESDGNGNGNHELKEANNCIDNEEDKSNESGSDEYEEEYDIDEDDGFPRHHLKLPVDLLFRKRSDQNRDNTNIINGGSNIDDNEDFKYDEDYCDYYDDKNGFIGEGRGEIYYNSSYEQNFNILEDLYVNDEDGDSSASEPYQDDDPNDPEWRGETKPERIRKKT